VVGGGANHGKNRASGNTRMLLAFKSLNNIFVIRGEICYPLPGIAAFCEFLQMPLKAEGDGCYDYMTA